MLSHDGSTPGRIINGGLGSKRYRITFHGPGGHSDHAFGLVNPMFAMARAVAALGAVAAPPQASSSVGVTGKTASTDSNVPVSMGIPAITIPGGIGGNEHSLEEFIDVEPAANLRQISATLGILLALVEMAD